MMDLDKFKFINDTFGHDCGDRVIQRFGRVLLEVLRHGDIIARMGGDEFCAVLPGVNRVGASEIARRILQTASAGNAGADGDSEPRLAVSIGVCDNEVSTTGEDLLKQADMAMYAAKRGASHSYQVWEP